jgi:Trk K+ transport system NAD-binding subunit
MRSKWRRALAYLYYLKRPLINFLPLLMIVLVLLIAGSFCFHKLYQQQQLGYLQALYITFCLVFMEHLIEFPQHWLLQLFYFVLPPFGLAVILDGIVRFSYHVLRRDETGKEWARAMCKTLNTHVILCGLGRLGLRTLQQLLHLGEQVAILEKNPQCPNLAYARKHGVPVLIGHSREEGIFNDLNITRAKSIILATNDDLANLEMALDARKLNPEIRVVLRMFDQELAAKLRESLDMELTFSTSELAAPLFATSSCDRSIANSFYVNGQVLVIANLTINPDSQLIGRELRELGSDHHAFILSLQRQGEATLFPSAQEVLAPGDGITVQTTPECLKGIHQLNHDETPY